MNDDGREAGPRPPDVIDELRRGLRPTSRSVPSATATAPGSDATPLSVPRRRFAPEVEAVVRGLLRASGLEAAASDALSLLVVDRDGEPHAVGPAGLVIGRSHSSGPRVDIAVSDLAVSRRHAVITVAAKGGLAVADASSTNGTRISRGVATLAVETTPVPLQAGDRLFTAGDVLLCEVVRSGEGSQ